MKHILSFLFVVGFGFVSTAQVLSNQNVNSTITNSNVFLDASTNFSVESGTAPYIGKGLVIPSVDLVNFEFDLNLADGATFPTYFDGMIVYNGSQGTTETAGDRSSTATDVVPGFYYFSNPLGSDNLNVTGGRWLPLGNSSIATKTREVIKTIEVGATTATVDLTTGDNSGQGMAGVTVNQFIGAKIYNNATGQLQMDASSSYVDGTAKILTTGNGFISQVLPAGTYKFVIEYK